MQAHQNSIKVNILLHQRSDGKTVASMLEIPDCTVEESSREQAISSMRENLIEKLESVEIVSIELPINQHDRIDSNKVDDLDLARSAIPDRPWLKSAGIFKTDSQFEEFQQEIQSYRNELDIQNH